MIKIDFVIHQHSLGPLGSVENRGLPSVFNTPRDLANVHEWKIMFNPYNVVLNKDVKPLYNKYKTAEHAHFTINLGVHLISHFLPENCIIH